MGLQADGVSLLNFKIGLEAIGMIDCWHDRIRTRERISENNDGRKDVVILARTQNGNISKFTIDISWWNKYLHQHATLDNLWTSFKWQNNSCKSDLAILRAGQEMCDGFRY